MTVGSKSASFWRSSWTSFIQWFDSDYGSEIMMQRENAFDWVRCIPFILIHMSCLAVFWVGWSWPALSVAVGLYFIRMFAVTGFYHRYFSHRTFRTSRVAQFIFAVLGASAAQRGPLWWAAHHRYHHQHSDEPTDAHSPKQHGFWWAHVGWITSPRNFPTNYGRVRDLAKFPELVFLNRFDVLVPTLLGTALFLLGVFLAWIKPEWGTSGSQMLVWGFVVSTTVLFHATASINSLAHVFGRRRFETDDDSRNSLLLALVTLGEGWHNNHHMDMTRARQGLKWWEIDVTFYVLKLFHWTGIIWNVR